MPAAGASVGLQGSNADQIKDLGGPFYFVGGSGGEGFTGGGSWSWRNDSCGRPVYGGQIDAGAGVELPAPAEVRGGISQTATAQLNTPRTVKQIWQALFG